MPFSTSSKRDNFFSRRSHNRGNKCEEQELGRIITNDKHAPRKKPDDREGATSWEKQSGLPPSLTRKEKVEAWLSRNLPAFTKPRASPKAGLRALSVTRLANIHSADCGPQTERSDLGGLDRAVRKAIDVDPSVCLSREPSINRSVTIGPVDSFLAESSRSSPTSRQRMSTETVLQHGYHAHSTVSLGPNTITPSLVHRTRSYSLLSSPKLQAKGLKTSNKEVPDPFGPFKSRLMVRDDTKSLMTSSSCPSLSLSSTVARSFENLPITPPNVSASPSRATVNIFDAEANGSSPSLLSTASSLSNDDSSSFMARVHRPETPFLVREARLRLISEPGSWLIPEPQMAQVFSSYDDPSMSPLELETMQGSIWTPSQSSSLSLPPEAEIVSLRETVKSLSSDHPLKPLSPEQAPLTELPHVYQFSDLQPPSLRSFSTITDQTQVSTPRSSVSMVRTSGNPRKESQTGPCNQNNFYGAKPTAIISDGRRDLSILEDTFVSNNDHVMGKSQKYSEDHMSKKDEESSSITSKGPETRCDRLIRSVSSSSRSIQKLARRSRELTNAFSPAETDENGHSKTSRHES